MEIMSTMIHFNRLDENSETQTMVDVLVIARIKRIVARKKAEELDMETWEYNADEDEYPVAGVGVLEDDEDYGGNYHEAESTGEASEMVAVGTRQRQ